MRHLKLSAFFVFTCFAIAAFAQNSKKEIILAEGNWEKIRLPSETPLPIVDLIISFNRKALFIKASVKDNHIKDGDRSWRYGDGFYINFVTPLNSTENSSDKFYGFGFSVINKQPASIVVNKDGEYFPKLNPPPLPIITIDSTDSNRIKTAEYFIEIPWKNVYSFNPLKDQRAGINIVYISQSDDRSRIIQMTADDDNYDTELTNFRKFIPLRFKFSLKSSLNITGELERRLIEERKFKAKLWVHSPENRRTRFTLKIKSAADSLISIKYFTRRIRAGSNLFYQTISLPKNDGLFKVSISINDSILWEDAVIKYRAQRLSQTPEVIKLLSHTSHNKFIDFGCDVITYHIGEIRKEIEGFDNRKDIYSLHEKFNNLDSLIELFTEEKTILKKSGYLECAFRSIIDSSLQPFSLVLPENFDSYKKYDMLLVLHGSGVDEAEIAKNAARNLQNENLIIAAPQGRDLSSWYNGITEKDIIDLIHYLKILLKIDKIFLYGFSMGGYGVWRFGMLYPEFFSGGIVISGIPFNPKEDIPEYNMNNYLNNPKKLDYLVIHGTDDNSLKIDFTDSFVEKLKKLGYKIEYNRIAGGGHGNINPGEFIINWFKRENFAE
jgi:predicted esterase